MLDVRVEADGRGIDAMQVSVLSTAPVVRDGITSLLTQEGFEAFTVDAADLAHRSAEVIESILVVYVPSAGELAYLTGQAGWGAWERWVALVSAGDSGVVHLALAHGALAAVPVDSMSERIVAAVRAAASGLTAIPSEMSIDPQRALEDDLGRAEVEWLRSLAAGRSVAEVAERAGFSSRVMFRLLNATYAKVGATSRIDALVISARAGLI